MRLTGESPCMRRHLRHLHQSNRNHHHLPLLPGGGAQDVWHGMMIEAVHSCAQGHERKHFRSSEIARLHLGRNFCRDDIVGQAACTFL